MLKARHHISSAVVTTRQKHTGEVAAALSTMDGVEVHATAPGKIVVVIEGSSAGVLGETLIAISALDRVIGAHMVFEQSMEEADDERVDAA